MDRENAKRTAFPAVAVVGEVLWDVFGDSRRLGGAPLNFAAHAAALGHPVSLISALGTDALGDEAAKQIALLGLDTRLVQRTPQLATGAAEVGLGTSGEPEFTIARPAAYDGVELGERELETIRSFAPGWVYFGTLFAAGATGESTLDRLLGALDGTKRFLDLNLRPGSDAPALAARLLAQADVVKLNEHELAVVSQLAGLPIALEDFCVAASERYGLRALAVTRGDRGCAVLAGGDYAEAPAVPVAVADTVGAGDAFAAAFIHGLSRQWPAARLAAFANGIAAGVASRHGSLPDRSGAGSGTESR
jgi:fructokinase